MKGRIIKEMAECDLSQLKTLEAANSIRLIKDVAVLILPDPKDIGEDVAAAIDAIPKEGVACVRRGNGESMINGSCLLSDENLKDGDNEYYINGSCVIYNVGEGKTVTVSVNGSLLIQESAKNVIIKSCNGSVEKLDFDHYVASAPFLIDAAYLEGLRDNTLVDDIYLIEADVTAELLKRKKITLRGKAIYFGSDKLSGVNYTQMKVSGYKDAGAEFYLDAQTLKRIPANTLVIAKILNFDRKITMEMLEEKNIKFQAKVIRGAKKVRPYLFDNAVYKVIQN